MNNPLQNLTFGDMANGDSIVYVYGAGGNKLQKLVYENSSLTASTDYAGAFVYKDNLLNFIQSAEGRITKTTSEFVYEYHLKDHIGNVRVAFIDDNGTAKVIQESDYYPFGLKFGEQRIGSDNKYLFSGKEQQDDVVAGVSLDWYDFGARMYSAELGRWHAVDNYAADYHMMSPYTGIGNNPINYYDPDGNRMHEYIMGPRKEGHGGGGEQPGDWERANPSMCGSGFSGSGYSYNPTSGKYYNSSGDYVTWDEVYNNYVIPNGTTYIIPDLPDESCPNVINDNNIFAGPGIYTEDPPICYYNMNPEQVAEFEAWYQYYMWFIMIASDDQNEFFHWTIKNEFQWISININSLHPEHISMESILESIRRHQAFIDGLKNYIYGGVGKEELPFSYEGPAGGQIGPLSNFFGSGRTQLPHGGFYEMLDFIHWIDYMSKNHPEELEEWINNGVDMYTNPRKYWQLKPKP